MGNDNPVTQPFPPVSQSSRPAGRSARRLVAAPDKYRGTATAAEVAAGIERAATAAGWACDTAPVADGGEGTLEALGGAVRSATVRGPLGDPVARRVAHAGRRHRRRRDGPGLGAGTLVGGPEGNDPLRASTYGTGELIGAAIDAGATRVVVGVGGSATTDGGLAALSALRPDRRPGLGRAIEVVVACDVTTLFVDAAECFGPQKGATPAQVSLLRRRLERLAEIYLQDYGVDVRDIPGSGAAGGLAGGLAAAGAELVPGFDVVAEALGLAERIAGADLVVTGEGTFDAGSFDGKAVGGVLALAAEAGACRCWSWPATSTSHGLPALPDDVEVIVPRRALRRRRRLRRHGGLRGCGRGRAPGPVGLDLDHRRPLGQVGVVPSGAVGHPRPAQGDPQHRRRLVAQLVEAAVAVGAGAEVDLGDGAGPEPGGHVDEQAQVDAVALHERHPLQHLPPGRELAAQGLADGQQVGEEQAEQRAGHQLGHPATAHRAVVVALDEADARRRR